MHRQLPVLLSRTRSLMLTMASVCHLLKSIHVHFVSKKSVYYKASLRHSNCRIKLKNDFAYLSNLIETEILRNIYLLLFIIVLFPVTISKLACKFLFFSEHNKNMVYTVTYIEK